MTTETAVHPLTAMDIRALRECDSASLWQRDGQGWISPIKKLAKPTPWETEARIDIPVKSYIHTGMWENDQRERTIASEYYGACQYDDEWKTIMGLLKPGDVLTLKWRAGKGNQHTDNAGFEWYTLHVQIERGEKCRMSFLLSHNVGPRNSGSMVR